jgi:hypothetical protein
MCEGNDENADSRDEMNVRGSGESSISTAAISTPEAPAVADHSRLQPVMPSRKRLRQVRSPSVERNVIPDVDESATFCISTPNPPTTHLLTPVVTGTTGVAVRSPSETLNSPPLLVETTGESSLTSVAYRFKISFSCMCVVCCQMTVDHRSVRDVVVL